MDTLSNAAGILNTIIILLALIGGYLALRNGKTQRASEIQSQVIDALKAELDTLQRRIEIIERENARLYMTINLIKSALRKRGFNVTIDGDMVTIDDGRQKSSHSQLQDEKD